MKRITVLFAAAVMASGSFSPALAISTAEPGFFNKCATAYVSDPTTYERDCAASMKSLMDNPIGPAPTVTPAPAPPAPTPGCAAIDTRLFPLGMRTTVALAPCTPPCVSSIDTRNFPIWARVRVAANCLG